MRKLLVFQHVPYEPLGVLDPLLRRAGFRIRYVNFGRTPDSVPDIGRYDGLVVLGGPMNVDQVERYPHLLQERQALVRAVEREIPVLGICLGAQLLASALGADVRPNPVHEVGWYPLETTVAAAADPLFRHVTERPHLFQWHAYTFDLPSGAVHLASTATCPNQAFRYGSRAYGLQFHLEADAALIDRWLHAPHYRQEVERSWGAGHIEHVRLDTGRHMRQATALGARVFAEFVHLFDRKAQFRVLASLHGARHGEPRK